MQLFYLLQLQKTKFLGDGGILMHAVFIIFLASFFKVFVYS